MALAKNCVYKTPCGWCARLDKKCNSTTVSDAVSDEANQDNVEHHGKVHYKYIAGTLVPIFEWYD